MAASFSDATARGIVGPAVVRAARAKREERVEIMVENVKTVCFSRNGSSTSVEMERYKFVQENGSPLSRASRGVRSEEYAKKNVKRMKLFREHHMKRRKDTQKALPKKRRRPTWQSGLTWILISRWLQSRALWRNRSSPSRRPSWTPKRSPRSTSLNLLPEVSPQFHGC